MKNDCQGDGVCFQGDVNVLKLVSSDGCTNL